MPRKSLLLLFVATFLSAASGASAAAGDAVVEGLVENGTRGRVLPAQLRVEVMQVTETGETIRSREVDVRDGRFSAGGFDPSASSHYLVTTTYRGVVYSAIAEPSGIPRRLRAGLTIFETTTDPTAVTVASDTVVVGPGEPGTLAVMQRLRFANASDRTYIGQEEDGFEVLHLPLATGGVDVTPVEGVTAERLEFEHGHLLAGDPVQPGFMDVAYAYRLDDLGPGDGIERAFTYPTRAVRLLVSPELTFSSPGLEARGRSVFRGRPYEEFEGRLFTLGDSLEFDVTASPPGQGGPGAGAGMVVALAFAAAVGLLLWWRRSSARPSPAAPEIPDEREDLIRTIARLDLDFSTGKIAADDYRDRRDELKQRLVGDRS